MIEVVGVNELVRDFTAAAVTVVPRARQVIDATAHQIAERAAERAPKRRPQLAPSITSEMIDMLTAEIGPENALGGGYGHIVEKGLAGRPPQPFLGPALDETDRDLTRDVGRLLESLIR
jgi:HK97 gp10 family phage protein